MYRSFYFKRWDICDGRNIYSKRLFKKEKHAQMYSKFIAVLIDIYTKGAEYGICYGVEEVK